LTAFFKKNAPKNAPKFSLKKLKNSESFPELKKCERKKIKAGGCYEET